MCYRHRMIKPNKAAQLLGKLAKGKPKHYSKTELLIRTERLLNARKKLRSK